MSAAFEALENAHLRHHGGAIVEEAQETKYGILLVDSAHGVEAIGVLAGRNQGAVKNRSDSRFFLARFPFVHNSDPEGWTPQQTETSTRRVSCSQPCSSL